MRPSDIYGRMTDAERRISQNAMLGTIEKVDYENGRYRVRCGDLLTDWLPMRQTRAGKVRSWEPLHEREQVLIVSPSGDLAQGVIVASLASEEHPLVSNDPDVTTTVFGDGLTIEHNERQKTFKISGPVGATIETTIGSAFVRLSETSIELSADTIRLNGNVQISGDDLSHNNLNVGSTHVHGGVERGGANTMGPR